MSVKVGLGRRVPIKDVQAENVVITYKIPNGFHMFRSNLKNVALPAFISAVPFAQICRRTKQHEGKYSQRTSLCRKSVISPLAVPTHVIVI